MRLNLREGAEGSQGSPVCHKVRAGWGPVVAGNSFLPLPPLSAPAARLRGPGGVHRLHGAGPSRYGWPRELLPIVLRTEPVALQLQLCDSAQGFSLATGAHCMQARTRWPGSGPFWEQLLKKADRCRGTSAQLPCPLVGNTPRQVAPCCPDFLSRARPQVPA